MNTGVQPVQAIRAFVNDGLVKTVAGADPIVPVQYQPASLDLRLGHFAWRVRSSFLPGPGRKVMDRVTEMDGYPIDLTRGAVLETNGVYVIPLQEELYLPDTMQAFANPKSTTGRLDIMTRLVTDEGTVFDQTPKGYRGPLFLEVAPQTFSVVVQPGTRLNQVRFQRGTRSSLSGNDLKRRYYAGDLMRPYRKEAEIEGDLIPVTVDLRGDARNAYIGFRAKRHTDRIDLEKVNHYSWADFWEPVEIPSNRPGLTLDPGEFYILATVEEVRVPGEFAAEMVPYSSRSGEYRVHYAGFFDPGFGLGTAVGGSKGVLEVRSHEIPFMLEHGQTVGWLRYDKMSEAPDILYGAGLGSNYQGQGLALAKHFTAPPRPEIPLS